MLIPEFNVYNQFLMFVNRINVSIQYLMFIIKMVDLLFIYIMFAINL